MGFKKVLLSLEDLFPQIDPRALRAVAIEHSKDIDAAVMAVLDEIVPFFKERSSPSSPLNQSVSVAESSDGEDLVGTTIGKQESSGDADDGPNEPFYDAISELTFSERSYESKVQMCADVYSPGEPVLVIDENRVDTLQTEMSGDSQTNGTISGDKCPESSNKISSDRITQHTVENSEDVGVDISEKTDVLQENEEISGHLQTDFGATCNEESRLEQSFSDGYDTVDETSLLSVDNIIGKEEESTLNVSLSKSSQIHMIDVIEEIIADARNNKKTLFSQMESIISLMRQVELKEQAAEQAKAEAAMCGMDTLNKVEELKRMLQYAKEANDMHAGEVYGEKAILATELRELRTRVLSLSDERDKSLEILDEMRQTLEVRLAAAEDEIESAEQEKLEKEMAARKSLDEQELIMEKVVQESKILKQLAEENAKLQEFLVDRGCAVDTLQGEIAVICQDVRLLKEKFDQRVPFTKSLISSHTSFILASSNSSLKSLVPDHVQNTPSGNLLETQKNSDHELGLEEEAARDDRKALQGEGWEIFGDADIVD